jgi:4-hydroxythreonine-4-phosphate dehydrogenase
MEKPIIAITMGDPAGIGPELVVKVLSQAFHFQSCHPIVIGDM